MVRAGVHGFSVGSSADVVRPGKLFPMQPYTSRVNTFHAPSVESALLHTFTIGEAYRQSAPFIFDDTIEKARTRLYYSGCMLGADPAGPGATVGDFIGESSAGVPGILTILPEDVRWTPAAIRNIADSPASDYTHIIALYIRVNGAGSVLRGYRMAQVRKPRYLAQRVERFIEHHVPVATYMDSLEDPRDEVVDEGTVAKLLPSMGPTQFAEDADQVRVTTEQIRVNPTPLEVLDNHDFARITGHAEFGVPVDKAIAGWRSRILKASDDHLATQFIMNDPEDEEGATSLPHYYPRPMSTPSECRQHSIFLSCLLLINTAWSCMNTMENVTERWLFVKRAEGDEWVPLPRSKRYSVEEDILTDASFRFDPEIHAWRMVNKMDEDDAPVMRHIHPKAVRHALHCYVAAFVPLLHSAFVTGKFADREWEREPEAPCTPLDLHFPWDTSSFHAGDLPNLDCISGQIGLYGEQVVKDKLPIVMLIMKGMPFCCQSRELLQCLLELILGINGEGIWRVLRGMFLCSLCGMYPSSENRADVRSLLRIKHLLGDREAFCMALDWEMKANEGKPDKDRTNKTCLMVFVVLREYYIYMASGSPAYLESAAWRFRNDDKGATWAQFVTRTAAAADEMRRWARFADAPEDNPFRFALNALARVDQKYKINVYRFRKYPYSRNMMNHFNSTQDAMHAKKRREADEIAKLNATYLSMHHPDGDGTLTQEELRRLDDIDCVREDFRSDPRGFYAEDQPGFAEAVVASMKSAYGRYRVLSGSLNPGIQVNIIDYMVRAKPSERLRFEAMLSSHLGQVSLASVQVMYRTLHIYRTRSSPKSLETQVTSLGVGDFRVFSWFFNVLMRIEKISVIPLDVDTVSDIGQAMRSTRYHLFPDEPLPDSAYDIYVTICCGRICTFSDTATYGNFRLAFDPLTRNFVCAKKSKRAARARSRAAAQEALLLATTSMDKAERRRKMNEEQKKKARTERKGDNAIPCANQPVMRINIRNHALVFADVRYQHCGGRRCGQLHMYDARGWGCDGYRCPSCREKEQPAKKMERCDYCGGDDRGKELKTLELIAGRVDPTNPNHDMVGDPMSCLQAIHMCQKHANSAGLYEKHPSNRLYRLLDKQRLWPIIESATSARMIENDIKYM